MARKKGPVYFITPPPKKKHGGIIPTIYFRVGWVYIGIGAKGKRSFVVSLAKVWEIAKKFRNSIYLYSRGHYC
jgi:hypothetical protein